MTRSDAEHVANAQEHLRVLRIHLLRSDLVDDTVFDAVCMRLAAAIESISAVDPIIRDRIFGASWPAIASVRNRIAHGYFYVDREIIEDTVAHDLDELEVGLAQLANAIDPTVGQRPRGSSS